MIVSHIKTCSTCIHRHHLYDFDFTIASHCSFFDGDCGTREVRLLTVASLPLYPHRCPHIAVRQTLNPTFSKSQQYEPITGIHSIGHTVLLAFQHGATWQTKSCAPIRLLQSVQIHVTSTLIQCSRCTRGHLRFGVRLGYICLCGAEHHRKREREKRERESCTTNCCAIDSGRHSLLLPHSCHCP